MLRHGTRLTENHAKLIVFLNCVRTIRIFCASHHVVTVGTIPSCEFSMLPTLPMLIESRLLRSLISKVLHMWMYENGNVAEQNEMVV